MFYGLNAKEEKLLKSILQMLGVMFGKIFHSDHLIMMSRCMGFFEDSRFMESYQKAAGKCKVTHLSVRRLPVQTRKKVSSGDYTYWRGPGNIVLIYQEILWSVGFIKAFTVHF